MSTARARSLRKSMSPPEAILWNALRELKPLGHHFRRQVQLGPYYADFASHRLKLVLEVDGDEHGFNASYDQRRDALIAAQGYKVLRIPAAEVNQNLDGVMLAIVAEIELRAPGPTPTLNPSPQGEGGDGAQSSLQASLPLCGEGLRVGESH